MIINKVITVFKNIRNKIKDRKKAWDISEGRFKESDLADLMLSSKPKEEPKEETKEEPKPTPKEENKKENKKRRRHKK